MMLPTIAPTAVLPSVGEPVADVGPAEVDGGTVRVDDPVEVTDNEEVPAGVVDDVGDSVEEDVARVEEGVTLVELSGVGDTGGKFVVVGGVGPP